VSTPGEPIFELRGVGFRFPEAEALADLSFALREKECVFLLGANGSGKSTLLRLLAGLAFPTRGELRYAGAPLTEEALMRGEFAYPFRQRVAITFQNSDVQLFNPSVFDELAFGPLQMRWPREKIVERVEETLRALDILHLQQRAPHQLSEGEKKRVALASVLVLEPEVLLLDEPTAALDPQSRSRMIDFLFDCRGVKTVIVSTHELALAQDLADRCLVLENGRLAADGPPEQILEDEALLRRAHLLHTHRHRHGSGVVHAHPQAEPGHVHGA
jgi:cobalt/nickel transport system ATP-binding protein